MSGDLDNIMSLFFWWKGIIANVVCESGALGLGDVVHIPVKAG